MRLLVTMTAMPTHSLTTSASSRTRQPMRGRMYGIGTHDDAEHGGRHPAQGDQVGQVGHRRGEHAAGHGQQEWTRGRGSEEEGHGGDGRPDEGGDACGGRGAAPTGDAGTDHLVEQDVGGPGSGGGESEADPEEVTGRLRGGDEDDADRRHESADRVESPP